MFTDTCDIGCYEFHSCSDSLRGQGVTWIASVCTGDLSQHMVCVASNLGPRCRGDVYARDMCEQALNLSVPWLFRRRQVGLVLQEWCGIAFPLNLLCSILIYRHISGSYATHQEHWSDACALRYKVRQCWWYAEVFICVNDFSASCLILFLFFHTPYCFSPSTLLDRHT